MMTGFRKNFTGAVFAGGQSTRMGLPKEGVILRDKRPMIEHVIDALRPYCNQILIVGACKGYRIPKDPHLLQLEDINPGHGPLSALEALLSSGFDEEYLVTSCDQPLLTATTIARLTSNHQQGLSFFRSASNHRLDPFPGIFPIDLLPDVQQAMKQGRYSIWEVIQRRPIRWVTLPDEQLLDLANANTPDQLQKLEARLLQKEGVGAAR